MHNVKIIFSYDGSKFSGSQIQPHCMSVQEKIESALLLLGIETSLTLAGRTDKNVHASFQVANFFIPSFWQNLDKLKMHLNQKLKPSIFVRTIEFVSETFHSRFSAKKRLYRYICSTAPFCVFHANYLHYVKHFDIQTITNAAKLFEGEHDFEFFSKTGSKPKSTQRIIYATKVYSPKKDIFVISILGNGFLRSQVRMMIHFLLEINNRNLTLQNLQMQLLKHHKTTTKLAPANGLYLAKIYYH